MFAPQARLVDVSSGRVIGTNVQRRTTETQREITTIIAPDLISAVVTQVNTGVSTVTITLNNQRVDPVDHKRPIYPPWKFNDFSGSRSGSQDTTGTYALKLGQRVRVDFRYGSGPWTKMILARITDLAFSFPADGGSRVVVTGEDLMSILKVKPTRDHPYPAGRQEEEIFDDVLQRARAGVSYARGDRPIPRRDQGLPAVRHQKSQTYFQFMTDIADRLDTELYVDFVDRNVESVSVPGAATADESNADSTAIDVSRELEFRMEPARSGIRPSTRDEDWTANETRDRSTYIELRHGKSLIDFTPTLKVWEMPTSANVSGSHPHRRGRARGEITAADIQSAIRGELWPSESYPDATPIDAISARREYFGDANDAEDNADSSHTSHLDQQRTRMQALASVLKKVREFLTVEAKTIGVPKLRAGKHVHILGLRPPFDGFYYVTKTVHTLDGSGYFTQLALRRPGMLPPGMYMTASREEQQEREQREQAAQAAGARP